MTKPIFSIEIIYLICNEFTGWLIPGYRIPQKSGRCYFNPLNQCNPNDCSLFHAFQAFPEMFEGFQVIPIEKFPIVSA
jgi:hypothetical protein